MLRCFWFFLSLKFCTFARRDFGLWQIFVHFSCYCEPCKLPVLPFVFLFIISDFFRHTNYMLNLPCLISTASSLLWSVSFLCPSLFLWSDFLKTVLYWSNFFSMSSVFWFFYCSFSSIITLFSPLFFTYLWQFPFHFAIFSHLLFNRFICPFLFLGCDGVVYFSLYLLM